MLGPVSCGGSGGGSGDDDDEAGTGIDLGSLDLTGLDTAGEVADRFEPTLVVDSVLPMIVGVTWSFGVGSVFTLTITNGAVSQVTFITASPSNVNNVYSYLLNCTLTPALCTGFTLDLDAKSLDLDNMTIPIAAGSGPGPTNVATGDLGADGTLFWE